MAPLWQGDLSAATALNSPYADPSDQLTEIVVEGHGPRFVAPTRRDRIGRIWAPVYINGKGPFRLVLDTGATQSALTSTVASILALPLDRSPPMLLRGVTGTVTVPTVKVDTLTVGDLSVDEAVLPIVPDALGGADGILGTAGLFDKRIRIDFRRDRITITYSRGERAERDFQTIRFRPSLVTPIIVDAYVGDVPAKAIIDTGGQLTIANYALRDALVRNRFMLRGKRDQIQDATKAVKDGEIIATPAIAIGSIEMHDAGVTYSDLPIFSHWHLMHRPAILIGMDALGLLDTLVIDYKRHELQLRLPEG